MGEREEGAGGGGGVEDADSVVGAAKMEEEDAKEREGMEALQIEVSLDYHTVT